MLIIEATSRLSLAGIQKQADGLLHPGELEGGQAVTIVQLDNASADDAAHIFVDEVRLGREYGRFVGKSTLTHGKTFRSWHQAASGSLAASRARSACARSRASTITARSSAKFPQLSLKAANR